MSVSSLLAKIHKYNFDNKIDSLLEEELLLKEKLEGSLYEFTKVFWKNVEGGIDFIDNWHFGAICEHLEATYAPPSVVPQIRTLIINIPPRMSKSTAVSVMFQPWVWTKVPSYRFYYASYAQSVALKDSVKSRRIIQSSLYQRLWGSSFQLCGDVNTKIRYENTSTGQRLTTSVDGVAAGEGGDFLIIDDANNFKKIESEVTRNNTNEWWDHSMSSRYNDPKTGRNIHCQQRTHELDLTGHILGKGKKGVVHLMLPMEFEAKRKCITVPLPSSKGKVWCDPRKVEGELLCPSRFGKPEVENLKLDLATEYIISGQLQQSPSPSDGGILKKKWFQWYKHRFPPSYSYVVQSWDTAVSTKADACVSACTTWGIFEDETGIPNVLLISVWSGRLEHPDLRRMAKRLSRNYYDTIYEEPYETKEKYEPDIILIEAAMNGQALAADMTYDLRKMGVRIHRFFPKIYGDKIARARSAISPMLEAGRIWVPAQYPNYERLKVFADKFVDACAKFPNDSSKDLVDSMSQAFIHIRESGSITHPEDYKDDTINEFPEYDRPLYGPIRKRT